MIIHLLRHGEVFNSENVVYERLDGFSLSQVGFEMANSVAKYIANDKYLRDISHIYSSPLLRTVQTAEPIKKALNLTKITIDNRLIESKNNFAGKNIAKCINSLLKSGHFIKLFRLFYNPFRPSWGEPFKEVAQRMKECLLEIASNHKDQQILVVSHQSPIFCVRRVLSGKNPSHNPTKRECSLCSITTIEIDDETNKVLSIKYFEPLKELKFDEKLVNVDS